MDEFELKVAEHLRTAGGDERPPSGLGARIVSRAGHRRRRRHQLAAAVAVGAGATLAIPVIVISVREQTSPEPNSSVTQAVTVSPQPAVATISRRLPGGDRFKAMALGPDGTVLGGAVTIDSDGFVDPRPGVWQIKPGGASAEHVSDTPSGSLPFLWLMAVGGSGRVWPERETLKCLPAGKSGRANTLKARWDGREPFFAGKDVIVWSDPDRGELIVANGCEGEPRRLPVKATLEAFAHPYAFVRPGSSGLVEQVDVRTGAKTTIRTDADSSAVFGAGPDTLAWASGDTLTVHTLHSGARRTVHGLPYARKAEYGTRITVGDGLVVYSASHQDTDSARSLVYDLRTGKQSMLQGDAWASGDLLLWREADSYRLAHR
ncbi:hypothetical protein [Actinomadura rudentiformis]|uniref:WD40 repeat domain-containing protein n=1 Tax=Actinomadura rudentiformis TaxID=359158 RepID=A0A6H9YN01_9ACTN|nr:hypothetical protein [Actinomadura rudentiformis]KAB2348324.1 hypothetical protein F8566_16070 [Actinomadura rudentiformis]